MLQPTTSVHPRVCGELVHRPREALIHTRFIPACAGNSASAFRRRAISAVHPRVCGELAPCPTSVEHRNGSSPRVRGTPGPSRPPRSRSRFIPACAGNSRWHLTLTFASAVHPRVCGELLEDFGADVGLVRFIPACAGNSPARRAPSSRPTVHPRVCGELVLREQEVVAVAGSSPRVRGTPSA